MDMKSFFREFWNHIEGRLYLGTEDNAVAKNPNLLQVLWEITESWYIFYNLFELWVIEDCSIKHHIEWRLHASAYSQTANIRTI